MAYGNPTSSGSGEMDHDEGMEHSDPGTIHIPSDMLPEGMAAKCKPGDILEFKVTGPADGDGDVPVEYNYGDDGKDTSWEDELRHEMSPRTGETEPQSEPM